MKNSYSTLCASVLALLYMAGCGGGGGQAPALKAAVATAQNGSNSVGRSPQVYLTVTISWAARGRVVNTLPSVSSAVFTLKGASPSGSDYIYSVNRDFTTSAASTQTYTSPNPINTGTWPLSIGLYALPDGTGSLMGAVSTSATIAADGTGIPNITAVGTVASVTVTPGQRIQPGQIKNLDYTALDSSGNILPILNNSASVQIISGGANLRLSSGQLQGIQLGQATVTATVDGKTSAPTSIQVTYRQTEIGSPPGSSDGWNITGVNNSSQVVGSGYGSSGGPIAYLWSNGAFSALGSLPGFPYSAPAGINNVGQIVGNSSTGIPSADHATLWQNGAMTDLGLGDASSINNQGTIVGTFIFQLTNGSTQTHAFLYQNNIRTDLGAYNSALINDSGQILASSPAGHVVLLQQSGQLTADLGAGTPIAINNSGQVLFTTSTNQLTQAYIWQNQTTTALGNPSGDNYFYPWGLTDSGQVFGDGEQVTISSNFSTSYGTGQFVWQSGQFANLNNLIPAAKYAFLPNPALTYSNKVSGGGAFASQLNVAWHAPGADASDSAVFTSK